MSKYMLLHCGFEMPTPEIMERWNAWFAETKDHTVDMGGFMNGRELTHDGTNDLPWGEDSITGYTIIEAEDMAAAEALAATNPFIKSIKIYEIRTG